MAKREAEAGQTPEPRRVLQCIACGTAVACSAEELLRYTRAEWPRCCGRVMNFYAEPTRPVVVSNPRS